MSSDALAVSVQETIAGTPTVINKIQLPYSILPADIKVALNRENYIINLSSLSDSSLRSLTGESALLEGFGEKRLKTTANLRAATAESAEIVVSNYFIGEAVRLTKNSDIPFKIERSPTFDPVKSGWKLLFNDEFEGSDVDWDKWFDFNPSFL